MKGQWRTVESVMAGVIILLFVAALGSTQMQVSPHAPVQIYRTLDALYEKETLRTYASAMNCTAIESLVSGTGYLQGYGHGIMVCNESNSCCGEIPGAENVWASGLLISGDENYKPVEVTLYVFKD